MERARNDRMKVGGILRVKEARNEEREESLRTVRGRGRRWGSLLEPWPVRVLFEKETKLALAGGCYKL